MLMFKTDHANFPQPTLFIVRVKEHIHVSTQFFNLANKKCTMYCIYWAIYMQLGALLLLMRRKPPPSITIWIESQYLFGTNLDSEWFNWLKYMGDNVFFSCFMYELVYHLYNIVTFIDWVSCI